MTEERKQELSQLLEEAMENLEIRYGYGGPAPLPVDVYKRYLQERWTCYGVDFLSFSFSIRLTPDIAGEITKSKLLDFIREELALFIDKDNIIEFARNSIPFASYIIENDSTNGSRLDHRRFERLHLFFLLSRLLEISIGRGIEEAVSVFDRCSYPEGTYSFFQQVTLLEGIELETEIQVLEGVRLIPLPSSETSEELVRYLFGSSSNPLLRLTSFLDGKALFIIDYPGYSIFHKSSREHRGGFHVDNLPSQVERHNVKFPNIQAVNSFRNLFCQVLSLICNSALQIAHKGWFLEEDKSFNPRDGSTGIDRHLDRFEDFAEVDEADIEKAKCLYDILDRNADLRGKLQIPIDRWVKSKTDQRNIDEITDEKPIDKIIDLGIAFEALYLSDVKEELTFRLGVRAAWYLGEDKTEREKLLKKFGDIYRCRSNAVHNGKLDETIRFGGERIRRSEFIAKAQDLCRQSILKIIEDGEFPDWNSLVLGGEDEQASS